MDRRNTPVNASVAMTTQILKLSTTTASYNDTNCYAIMRARNPKVEIFLMILLIGVFIFGTIFNSFAVWVFCCKMKKWSETRVFMMNLLFSDCCLLFTLPFRIYTTQYEWHLSNILCDAIRFCYFMNTYMGIAIITLISVDRYVAIKFPLRARTLRTPKKAALACGIIWLLFISTRLYLELGTDLRFRESRFCFRKVSIKPLKRTLYFTVFGSCIPMVILIFCSTQIIWTLKKKTKMSMNEEKNIEKTISIVKTNLAIFLFCFLPLSIGNIVRFVFESIRLECGFLKWINDFVHVTQGLSDLNCCLDSICYYFVAKEFWENASLFPKWKKQLIQDQTHESSI
ncbi:G-protein coupled receptor 35-like [Bufo bufo]|uniref:G-protein coupled receptor 35-like n=1 Tax=Bufo bufo TaxID=8384 RepID=UPI001ABEA8F5|nr:G-protein coupled receptor 35-like [Bufo bufo]XP_040283782.1 G-protein coupled receptor 35-like [Bufo bufo]